MSTTALTWGLIGLLALLILSGFFSSARAALGTVRRQLLRERAEQGNQRAAQALAIAENSMKVLTTFRIANLLTHFLVSGLIALLFLPALADWLTRTLALTSAVAYTLTYIVMVPLSALLAFSLAEVLPEVIIQRDPVAWAIRLAPTAEIIQTILTPIVAIMMALRRGVSVPLGTDVDSAMLVTEEEIMTLVDAGEEEGSIELEEKEMIYSIFQLDETLAREIMVPRIDIVALEIDTPLEEARKTIIDAGHSRIPVYEESLDRISGLLYAKDLLEVWHQGRDEWDLKELIRSALFIPESKRVSDLLHELQAAKVHMAIVIDEYGGTAGVVTIEDIVEEIVGEIFDEYDEAAEDTYEVISSDEYIFDARIDLDDFNRLLDTNLPDELGDTLAGFIYGQLGKVPDEGEIIETDRLQVEVLDIADRRIRKVRVKLLKSKMVAESSSDDIEESIVDEHVKNRNDG